MVLGCFFGCNDIWSAKDQIHMHYWLSLFGQDGWKLTNFFSCVFSWMETKSRLTQKKGTRQISSYLDQQTWSIEYSLLSKKNFTLIRIKNDFFFFFWELGKKGGHVPNKSFNMFSWFVLFFSATFYELFNSTPWNFHEIEAGNSERARCAHLACLLGNQSKHKICTILPTGAVSYVKDDMTVPELLAF